MTERRTASRCLSAHWGTEFFAFPRATASMFFFLRASKIDAATGLELIYIRLTVGVQRDEVLVPSEALTPRGGTAARDGSGAVLPAEQLRREGVCTRSSRYTDRVRGSAGRGSIMVARVGDAVLDIRPECGRGRRRPGSAWSMPAGVRGLSNRHLGELEGGTDDSDREWGGWVRKIG